MALNLYGTTNYELKVPLTIDYSRETAVRKYPAQPTYGVQYRYMRHVSKTYAFKGMDEKTTKACAQAKQLQYTRKLMEWTFYALYYRSPWEMHYCIENWREPPPYTKPMASLNINRPSEAPVFDVEITINETVAVYSLNDFDPSTAQGVAKIEELFMDQTVDSYDNPIVGDRYTVPYYHSYVHLYDYDENLSGDIIVS